MANSTQTSVTPSDVVAGPHIKIDATDRDQFTHLRHLLLGEEQRQLRELSGRLTTEDRRADDVSEVLAESFRRVTDSDDLVRAMAPSFGRSFGECVAAEPEIIADAVSPIIGPAIRQSIARTLQTMVQSTNQALEMSLSPQGLRWRLEAWRTGKSFGEVVILHTLAYRVQQVFLIHRKTGLLLHHVADSNSIDGGADSDMVSGMLTAIQDFVNDSFGEQDGDLDSVRVGDHTI